MLNLKATARLLDGYYRAAISGARPAEATKIMLQAYYGRGDASVGEMVAYDTKVREEAKRLTSQLGNLRIGSSRPSATSGASKEPPQRAPSQSPSSSAPQNERREAKPAPWDVFAAGQRSSVLVFQNQQSE